MTDSLSSVLDETITTEAEAPESVADDAVVDEQQEEHVNDSGEQEESTPTPEVVHEDKKQKGIESALLAERRKRQEAEAELARYRNAGTEQKEPQQEPQVGNYETYEQYVADLAKYHADQRFAELKANDAQRVEQARQQQQASEFEAQANTVIAAGRAKYPDFDQVINESVAPYLSPAMQQALVYSDNGAEVSYHLGKHPEDLQRIASMHPVHMIRELHKLEMSLAKPTAPAPVPKPVIPQTLTSTRDARGRYESSSDGPTPLDDILGRKT
jgi:hypothetical protein